MAKSAEALATVPNADELIPPALELKPMAAIGAGGVGNTAAGNERAPLAVALPTAAEFAPKQR